MSEEPIEMPEIVEEMVEGEEPTQKKKNKTLWIILIVVGVLLILCCCVALIIGGLGLREGAWLSEWFDDISFIVPMLA